jgi:hypothetical protein
MQPVTVIWSFFGDSGGRETGGDCGCGARGGSPGTLGGCATGGGACNVESANNVDGDADDDRAEATDAQARAVINIVPILRFMRPPPIRDLLICGDVVTLLQRRRHFRLNSNDRVSPTSARRTRLTSLPSQPAFVGAFVNTTSGMSASYTQS